MAAERDPRSWGDWPDTKRLGWSEARCTFLCDTDHRPAARALLAEIYDRFSEGFDTAELKDAKALLDELSSSC